jgi:hypothetical protein
VYTYNPVRCLVTPLLTLPLDCIYLVLSIMALRILILGDSHTREMNAAFKKLLPSCLTYTITVPRGLQEIIHNYHSSLPQINTFDPSTVIIHAGHNDIVYHHRHNLNPCNPRVITDLTLHLVDELSINHPGIQPYISSIFPRTFTTRSYLPQVEITPYNKKVKRHGQHLKTVTRDMPTKCLLNNCLWYRISSSTENPVHFDLDGLHLTNEGKESVVREWISIIYPTITGAINPDAASPE